MRRECSMASSKKQRRPRRKFTAEFKADVVRLCQSESIVDVARRLDEHGHAIRWPRAAGWITGRDVERENPIRNLPRGLLMGPVSSCRERRPADVVARVGTGAQVFCAPRAVRWRNGRADRSVGALREMWRQAAPGGFPSRAERWRGSTLGVS